MEDCRVSFLKERYEPQVDAQVENFDNLQEGNDFGNTCRASSPVLIGLTNENGWIMVTAKKAVKIMKKSSAVLRVMERFLLTLGVILLGFYALARVHGIVTLHAAMRSFEENKAAGNRSADNRPEVTDYSLWSPARIKAYKESLSRRSDPLAVLRIPKLRIVAPVLDGTDDLTLNSGVGRIPGTARPGQPGNIGIAGHRDGFFRGLKDIAKGDTIELATARETDVYVVDKVYIAKPDDVNILRPGPTPAVTLVTCYPFYFVGSAPERYIVQALLKRQAKAAGAL